MDDRRFDDLAKLLDSATTRRGLLGILAAITTSVAGGAETDSNSAAAKNRRHRQEKKRKQQRREDTRQRSSKVSAESVSCDDNEDCYRHFVDTYGDYFIGTPTCDPQTDRCVMSCSPNHRGYHLCPDPVIHEGNCNQCCTDEHCPDGVSCSDHGSCQCPEGLAWCRGRCVSLDDYANACPPPCTDDDCAANEVCDEAGWCVACEEGTTPCRGRCIEGPCGAECGEDSDCAGRQICTATGHCQDCGTCEAFDMATATWGHPCTNVCPEALRRDAEGESWFMRMRDHLRDEGWLPAGDALALQRQASTFTNTAVYVPYTHPTAADSALLTAGFQHGGFTFAVAFLVRDDEVHTVLGFDENSDIAAYPIRRQRYQPEPQSVAARGGIAAAQTCGMCAPVCKYSRGIGGGVAGGAAGGLITIATGGTAPAAIVAGNSISGLIGAFTGLLFSESCDDECNIQECGKCYQCIQEGCRRIPDCCADQGVSCGFRCCRPGSLCCDDICKDGRVDNQHCGRCNLACKVELGRTCLKGKCVCPPDMFECPASFDGLCCPKDYRCRRSVVDGRFTGNTCCPPEKGLMCNGVCSTGFEDGHCGSCTAKCGKNALCAADGSGCYCPTGYTPHPSIGDVNRGSTGSQCIKPRKKRRH